MGGTVINCQRTRQQNHTLIERELAIYQWRAQTSKKCIPTVSFKQNTQIKQQEKLDQFLSKYKQKDYFQLDQLKQEIQDAGQSQQQIVCFEKYACNFGQLNGVLEIDEIFYAFDSLLNSFEEIKKKYEIITVNKYCCFVTFNGELRGWINSNPKSNSLQNNTIYSYFGERDYKDIVMQISAMIKVEANRNRNIDQFFNQFQYQIGTKNLRTDIFGYARNWITTYSNIHQIPPSKNLAKALKKQRHDINQPTNKKSDSTIQMNFQTKRVGMIKNVCLNRFRRSPNYQQSLPQDFQDKFLNHNPHTENSTVTSFGCLHQSILPSKNYYNSAFNSNSTRPHSFKHSDQLETPNVFLLSSRKNPLHKSYVMQKTMKPVTKETQNSLINNQSRQNVLKNSKTHLESEGGTLIQGKFLTSKQITNGMSMYKKNRNDQKLSQSSHSDSKAVRVSILDIEHQEQKGSQSINKHASIHFQTMQELNSARTIIDKDKPFITCKTITRLIDRTNDFDSLVHSIQTSEQKGSLYGGMIEGKVRVVDPHRRSNTSYHKGE